MGVAARVSGGKWRVSILSKGDVETEFRVDEACALAVREAGTVSTCGCDGAGMWANDGVGGVERRWRGTRLSDRSGRR